VERDLLEGAAPLETLTMADYKKDIGLIVDELLKQGWRVRKGKHWVLYPADPSKPVCFMAQTPSSRRSLDTIRTKLRRAGARL
jgi:hypothetical protein